MITTSKAVSLAFLFAGVFILMQVVMPILSYEIWEIGQNFSNRSLSSPSDQSQVLGISIQTKDNFPALISSRKREEIPPYQQFSLTIPKIGLVNQTVFVDSNDLSKGLAQLPGSALPGERGNLFISGHSALTGFLARDAFFSKLPDVKVGDRIEVEAGGSRFTYQIIDMEAVDPTDVSVIVPPEQQGRYISLMTCVPPGLNFKRLVVLGKII